ncbi:MAG: 50S ribosomal protein L21 [Chloroflexota bacterium]|nr:50S ribosomal protein L21 [Chloroflexota bacterium]
MYAIIRTGNRQYRAEVGSIIDIERLNSANGDPLPFDHKIEITDVLMIADGDQTVIGQPNVSGATVKATVVSQYRAKKVIVFKYRQRTKFRRKRGHRHYYTRIRIDDIAVV